MTGTRVSIDGSNLVVEPQGWDRVWSFTRRLSFPLGEVKGAFFDPSVIEEPRGWRAPGLRVPGKVSGTFRTGGNKEFWNTAGRTKAIVVLLAPSQNYERLVLSVDEPLGVVDAINDARRRV
jgi:hypothetical protein